MTTKAKKKTATPETIAEVHLIPIELIDIQTQIRVTFDDDAIADLAQDIAQRGLMQPVLLNPNGDRYTMIAGERRLRATVLNGLTAIPALITKASGDDAFLMQLAENVQREDLTLEETCQAIVKLHKQLGSLDAVSKKVKKSVPWCSKRFSLAQSGLHWLARQLLNDGHTEDVELLTAFSALIDLLNWQESNEWAEKIKGGQAGRKEIREALKQAKADKKKSDEEYAAAAKVSHAKNTDTPPPPPAWTLEDAIEDLEQAVRFADNDLSGKELMATWTEEQQSQVSEHLAGLAKQGTWSGSYAAIRNRLIDGTWQDKCGLEWMAMIWGFGGREWDLSGFLNNLQTARD